MAQPETSSFGLVVRHYRRAAGLTQDELAERAQLSVRSVSDIERGVSRTPQRETVRHLADALELTEEERLEFERIARGHHVVGERLSPFELVGRHEDREHGVSHSLAGAGRTISRQARILPRRWTGLALAAIPIALLLVAVFALHPGTRTRAGPLSSAGSIAVWGGPTPAVTLRSPTGVAVDDGGNIYVADSGQNRIVKLSPQGQLLAQWKGAGHGSFRSPTAVAVDRTGNVFVADSGADVIRKLSPEGVSEGEWSGPHPDHLVQTAFYYRPTSVAMGTNGILYLTDPSRNWVVAVDTTSGGERYLFNTTTGPPGGIAGNPRGDFATTIPAAGRVYLCSNYYGPGGPSLEQVCRGYGQGLLDDPEGIALDGRGDMYIADRARDRIVELSPDGRLLGTWGREGAGPGQFNAPIGVALDRQGTVYVADTGNDRIQVFHPSG